MTTCREEENSIGEHQITCVHLKEELHGKTCHRLSALVPKGKRCLNLHLGKKSAIFHNKNPKQLAIGPEIPPSNVFPQLQL